MADIPTAVLSEHFHEVMEGRLLKAGVFLTFNFDPGFFEQEILPVFIDVALSQQPAVRLALLEEAIRKQVEELAVYYDAGGLDGEVGPAKLPYGRFKVKWPTGYFHPKNVLLLVEDAEPPAGEAPAQRLLVATLSANLNRSGWWENVESCHIEVVDPAEKSALREDVEKLCRRLRRAVSSESEHAALGAIERFLKDVSPRKQSTTDGSLHTRLYVGGGKGAGNSVPEFLEAIRGNKLRRCNLEVISPFFDDTAAARPLKDIIETFEPAETRVFLPRAADGSATCGKEYFEAVRALGALWAKLPAHLVDAVTQGGVPRRVHAKVYRFFREKPRYEGLFVGSVNLTSSAHSQAGNFETAFFVEPGGSRAPDWWLTLDRNKPLEFKAPGDDPEEPRQGPGIALSICYAWDKGTARAFWDDADASPTLHVAGGDPLFDLAPVPPREWQALTPEQAASIRHVLDRTSLLTVRVDDDPEPATILVQEDGMEHKPSILLTMSVADILRCWSALTPEQKAAIIDERYAELAGVASHLTAQIPLGHLPGASLFDSFAGIFHAFGSLERSVFKALESGRDKAAVHLLFGQKYDSLPHLLNRLRDQGSGSGAPADPVNRYVMVLCARQVVARFKHEASEEFRQAHADEIRSLEEQVRSMETVKDDLALGESDERVRFLKWFEGWFLRRAEPMKEAEQ